MKKSIMIGFFVIMTILALAACMAGPSGDGQSGSLASLGPYQASFEKYGQLKVAGRQLCDSNGNPVQLRGFSSHGLQWYGSFMNLQSLGFMATNWRIDVIRAAMYVEEGGYLTSPASMQSKVEEIIQAAVKLNLYCIIDWHILNPGDPTAYSNQARDFFTNLAVKYGTNKNLFYEICNEPNGTGIDWNSKIKPYAESVIPYIRAVDSNSIIIVGTGSWSQKVDDAAASPLSYSNIMYALHFYTGTHTQSLRNTATAALSTIAIFCTEWGTSEASGNNGPYIAEADNWLNWAAGHKISWCNWSLCDKSETSAALKPGASTTGGWADGNSPRPVFM